MTSANTSSLRSTPGPRSPTPARPLGGPAPRSDALAPRAVLAGAVALLATLGGCDSGDAARESTGGPYAFETTCSLSYGAAAPGNVIDGGQTPDAAVLGDGGALPGDAGPPANAKAPAPDAGDGGGDQCAVTHGLIDQYSDSSHCDWSKACDSPLADDCASEWWTPEEVQTVVGGLSNSMQNYCSAATILLDGCIEDLSCEALRCYDDPDCSSSACGEEASFFSQACWSLSLMLERNRALADAADAN